MISCDYWTGGICPCCGRQFPDDYFEIQERMKALSESIEEFKEEFKKAKTKRLDYNRPVDQRQPDNITLTVRRAFKETPWRR